MIHDVLQNDPLYLVIVGLAFGVWISGYCFWNARQQRRHKMKAARRQNEIQIWE